MIRIALPTFLCIYALSIVIPCSGLSAENALVTLVPPSEKQYWVGQRIGFSIELLVRGEFSGTPRFDLPELQNVILMKVEQRPTLSSRTIDGETYVVQQHEFDVFAQRAGTCTVPSFTVRFDSKERFDSPVAEHRLKTEPLELSIKTPEGATPGTAIVSTTELTAKEEWKPKPGDAKVGDALARTITIRAANVPGMLLPELTHQSIEGLEVYPKQPLVRDSSNRGTLMGERIESVTYVCSKSGSYGIPEQVIRWWNVTQKSWKELRFPSVTLKVSPNPSFSKKKQLGDASKTPVSRKEDGILQFVVVGVLIAALLAIVPILYRRALNRRKRRDYSEAGVFDRLVKACRRGDPVAADSAMSYWLSALGVSRETLNSIASGDTVLSGELRGLQEAVIGHGLPWNGGNLAERLRHIRDTRLKAQSQSARNSELPPLNPLPTAKRSP